MYSWKERRMGRKIDTKSIFHPQLFKVFWTESNRQEIKIWIGEQEDHEADSSYTIQLVMLNVVQESLAQFDNLIKPRVYVRCITRSIMYEKAPFC